MEVCHHITFLILIYCVLSLPALTKTQISSDDYFIFTSPVYEAWVPEISVTGSVVESNAMMGMWLTDYTSSVQYSIVGRNSHFNARKRIEGNFVFLELQARSLKKDSKVRVRALSKDGTHETFCTVNVELLDINDLQPLFPSVPYRVEIGENTKIGTTIFYAQATDSDRDIENKRFYYSLPDFTNNFAINPTTGAIMVTAPINYEYQSEHVLRIRVTDRKAALAGNEQPKETTLTVVVNTVNKQAPTITVNDPLEYIGNEVSHGKRVYTTLKIEDSDSGSHGDIGEPTIIRSDINHLFDIEPGNSNEYSLVFIRDPPPINSIINVTVEVSDLGTPPKSSTVTIPVQLYDRSIFVPYFDYDPFTFGISESSPMYTQIGFVNASILDQSKPHNLRYTITGGNQNNVFAVNPKTGLLTTRTTLDRNVKSRYTLKVSATNVNIISGNGRNITTVMINILDSNNHDPIFDVLSYSTRVKEGASIGSFITQVHAQDADEGNNASIIYSLVEDSSQFEINPYNGSIYTKQLLDYDLMDSKSYSIKVRASDLGTPYSRKSECVVVIFVVDQNDNAPTFYKQNCSILLPKSTMRNTKILQLRVFDGDRNSVSCSILSGDTSTFAIESNTCALRLNSGLDTFSAGKDFKLTVTATDGKLTSRPVSVNITLTSSVQLSDICHDTGEFTKYQENLNNNLISSSKSENLYQYNRTSDLPNLHSPKVLNYNKLRTISLPEDTPVGTVVATINAFDRDRGYNGELWYTLTRGNEDSCFFIGQKSGIVTLVLPLDREQRKRYNLTISISDMGTPMKAKNIQVWITVLDVNDCAPRFDQSLYDFSIPENVSVGYTIQRKVWAYDEDQGINAQVHYKMSTPVGGKHFFINPTTGLINVTKPLDREKVDEYKFTVTATDGSKTRPLSSTTTVLIHVTDINDNIPMFHQDLYRIRISEDLPVGTLVFFLEAQDPDSGDNGDIRYSLKDVRNSRDRISRFKIDDRTGAIRLAAPLNYRTQSRYNITARARDVKQRNRFSICYIEIKILPVNRNLYAPYFDFTDKRMEIAENASVGSLVGTVSALDEDITEPENEIRYSIVDGTGLGYFEIEPVTGAIRTTKSLDREIQQYYWLNVIAEDIAPVPLSGHMFVLVEVTDINDNCPLSVKPIYFASIEENCPLGTIVTTVEAFDKDTGSSSRLTYSTNSEFFKINSITGIVTTKKRKIDRETAKTRTDLTFEVLITDSGIPPLSSTTEVVVELLDKNDNDPYFMEDVQTTLNLPARIKTPVSLPIARVVALDDDAGPNSDIEYRLKDYNGKFTIDSRTGVISTDQAFQEGTNKVVKVMAYDHGNPQRNSRYNRVTISWGNAALKSMQSPTFLDQPGSRPEIYFEHVDAGYQSANSSRFIKLIEATDSDSDKLWYYIANGNKDHMFYINSNDGSLFVTGEPDAEKTSFYNLTVEVSDGYNSAFTDICISIGDVNDHRPQFSQDTYRVSIDENSKPNTKVIQLNATDDDLERRNRNLKFNIQQVGNKESLRKFRITTSGAIYTTSSLDREANKEHVLIIKVSDQGFPGALETYCRVVVAVTDSNDHAPVFSSPIYRAQVETARSDGLIGSDDTMGITVLKVKATDIDDGENARVIYSIATGNLDGLWRINPNSGEISATRGIVSEDGDTLSQSTFLVRASDCARVPMSSTAEIVISIATSKDVSPIFKTKSVAVDVNENARIGSYITTLTATAPSGITYNITHGNWGLRYSINANSGVVSLANALDREVNDTYNLLITAVNTNGKASTMTLNVTVLDSNDNRPKFKKLSYTGSVPESQGKTTSFSVINSIGNPLVVNGHDSDIGVNARLSYSIVNPSEIIAKKFTVDENTGAIRTLSGTGLFNYENQQQYIFEVQATDFGSPRLSTIRNTIITINVVDNNDSPPVFTQSTYQIVVYLPTAAGVVISRQIHAEDSDFMYGGSESNIKYSISGQTEGNAFVIDSKTGFISINNPNALEGGDLFLLRIRASDGKRSSIAICDVTVENLPTENMLLFSQPKYEATIAENSTTIQLVAAVQVIGTSIEDFLKFSILNSNPYFVIHSTTGVIKTTGKPVDREMQANYQLLVEAMDIHPIDENSDILRQSRVIVSVNVSDINDNAPYFIGLPYLAIVQIDARPGTSVKQVHAIDADIGLNKEMRYSVTGRYSEMFNINEQKGLVTIRNTPSELFNSENTKFNLTVLATDLGNPSLQGQAVLQISIVNRATPIFTQNFYRSISVPENILPHTVVTSEISASNPEGVVYYTILSGDPMNSFDIDFIGGTLTTSGNLDYEQTKHYNLKIRASDAQSRAHTDVDAHINVVDVNDNWPLFTQSSYKANLSELAAVGSSVVQVIANDLDSNSNGLIHYSILENSDSGYFYIDPTTGLILTTRHLNAEEKHSFSVVVRASDSGIPLKYSDISVNVFVNDVNDNAPVFNEVEYKFSVSVNTGKNDFVGKVEAFDLDKSDHANLQYSMRNNLGLFKIDRKTGVISATVPLDSILLHNILTNVSVSDGVFTSSCGVIINIVSEDDFPLPVVFEKEIYNFSVTDGSMSSLRIGQVQAIGSGIMEYKITNDDFPSQLFFIDSATGTLFTNTPIDREALFKQLFDQTTDVVAEITIQATDQKGIIGRCKVMIKVRDINDNAPVFTQTSYNAIIVLKQALQNQHVLKVTATDLDSNENGRITYSWGQDISNAKQFFRLNVDTGDIFIREMPRKRGNVDEYSFYVRAKDNGPINTQHTALVSVSIFLTTNSDSVPRFTKEIYNATITENLTVGSTVITVHAYNGNNDNIKYKIANPTDSPDHHVNSSQIPFSIDEVSGIITTSGPIDREIIASWKLIIFAYVDTTPQLITSTKVSIQINDVNDNAPEFTSDLYESSIVENLPKNTKVIQVFAFDVDSGDAGTIGLTYSFKLTKHSDLFKIDKKTGVIYTKKSFDHETESSYVVTVIASDNGQLSMTSECDVVINVIDVNDCEPQFSKPSYRVSFSESSPIGLRSSMVMRVMDNDTVDVSTIQMYIIEGNDDLMFSINSEQLEENENELRAGLQLEKKLDREVQSSYNLTVLATDGLFKQETKVTVSVSDVNDNAPLCSQLSYFVSVDENLPINSLVLKIMSTNLDIGSNGNIEYSISGEDSLAFSMNSNTGDVFTLSPLNREVKDVYRFISTSTDGGSLFCTSQVTINVNDVNDNAPEFEMSSLKTSPRENTPVNSLLHRVVAFDKDQGENGTYSLSLVDDLNGQFFLDSQTGVIMLKKPLDREKVSSYDLEILATDNGSQKQLSSTAILHIKVLDVNDNPPVFSQVVYEEYVSEDTQPGVVIAAVNAESIDTGDNANLMYSITHGNEHGKFSINPNSGEVRLISSVDYENEQSFVLTVSASDKSDNPLSADCTLRLIIEDVNDNSPEFSNDPYQISISEDTDIGMDILSVTAVDLDSGKQGNVTYTISSPQNLPFQIGFLSGKISIISPGLDFEVSSFYNLQVTASDQGLIPRHSKVSVLIDVEDVNDNRPQFLVSTPAKNDDRVITCMSNGANCTVYVHEGSNKPVDDGIVSLNSTDLDGPTNSGPFKYTIVSGNNAELFYLDPESNILKSHQPLRLDNFPHHHSSKKQVTHQILVSSEDSGIPYAMKSLPDLNLNVIVLKESQYAPEVTPHRIDISIYSNEFQGGNISSKLHAQDRDRFDEDQLRFSLSQPDDFEDFAVYPTTGAISARKPLSDGDHEVTVRVSDGSRSTLSKVKISVTEITDEILKNSVSINFEGITNSEVYLALYHSLFVDKLVSIMPDGFDRMRDFIVISLQENHSDNVELLFSIRKPPSAKAPFYESMALRGILANSQSLIEEKLRIDVSSIKGIACNPSFCDYGICQQIPNIITKNDDNAIQPVSTNTLSLLTLRFARNKQCTCELGKTGPTCESVCLPKNNPCPRSKTCSLDDGEKNGYTCESESNTVMAFSGHAFAQYKLPANTPLHVSLRIRSFQSNGTLFEASGINDIVRLDISSGLLKCTFDCGNGPQVIILDLRKVNDGKWHDVDIQHGDGNCAFKLILNNKFVASAQAPSDGRPLDITTLTMGGSFSKDRLSRSVNVRSKRNIGNLRRGYRGCLQSVTLNGEPLPNAAHRSQKTTLSGISLNDNQKVSPRCKINMGACVASPCLNNGNCLPGADGSHICECPLDYIGDNCEIPNPCGTLPCQNEGVCLGIGKNFRCDCKAGFRGKLCQTPSLCQNQNYCFNGGTCVINPLSVPTCICLPTWTGMKCEIDINECSEGLDNCMGECFNYNGGYACNCTNEKDDIDSRCLFVDSAVPLKTGESPIGIVVAISVVAIVIIILVAVGVLCWRRKHIPKGIQVTDDLAAPHLFNPENYHIPPVVPQRPGVYYPSSRDSFNYDGIVTQDHVPVMLVRPQSQLPRITPSASDSDSIRKPPASWQEYDMKNFNESASSSFQPYKSDHKSSIPSIHDQQISNCHMITRDQGHPRKGYDWDVTDWRPNGSGMVSPAVAHVALNGVRRPSGSISDMPSSPESRRSISSAATGRSRRSNKSDALSGHYSRSAKRRQQKQMMQMVDYNVMHDLQSRKRLQHQLSYCINQGKAPENIGYDSRGSSIRSSASRYQPSILPKDLPMPPVQPPYEEEVFHSSTYGRNNEFNQMPRVISPPACVTSDEPKSSSSSARRSDSDICSKTSSSDNLPPPPLEYELQSLQEENEKVVDSHLLPSVSTQSYTSLLETPYNVNLPTPSVARRNRFHPDQYLISHLPSHTDVSGAESVPGSQVSLEYFHPPENSLQDEEFTPAPPVRMDSERLELSSLSEDEEIDSLLKQRAPSKRKHSSLRPPIDPKSRGNRRQRKRANSKKSETFPHETSEKLINHSNDEICLHPAPGYEQSNA